MNFSRFFIDRPIFAGVLSTLIFVAGLLSLPALPISEYPEVAPPTVVVRAQYPGANPKVIAETVSTPIEEQINGVEGMLYMSSQATTDGLMTLNVTFRLGTDPDKAQQLVQNRVAQAEPRLPSEVRTPRHHHDQERARPHHGGASAVAERPLRHDLFAQLCRAQRQGPAGAHRRRRPGAVVRLRRLFDASLARSAEGRRARPVGRRRGARDPGPERPGRGRRRRGIAKRGRARSAALHQRPGAAADRGRIRRNHRQERRQWRSHTAARHRPDRARRGGLFAALASGQQISGRSADLPVAGLQRHPDLRHRPQDDGRAEGEHARRDGLQHRLRPDAIRSRLDRGGGAHVAGSRGPGRAGGHPVPADLARVDHSADRGAGFDHRHLCRDACVRLLDQRADTVRAGAGDRHRRR